jgi:hypothetical protein
VAELRQQCHLVVALSNLDAADNAELVKSYPEIDLLVTADDKRGNITPRPEEKPWLVQTMNQGKTLGVATFTATFTHFSFTKAASVTNDADTPPSCTTGPLASPIPLFSESADNTGCVQQSRFGDLEAVARWNVGSLELTAQVGHRFGNSYDVTADSRRWSSATATLWVTDRVALVAGGGRQPALPLRGIPARNYGMAGLELAYWPLSKNSIPVSLPHSPLVKSFEYRTATPGMQRITIHVGSVETVDVMGDFSDWNPVALVRRGRDTWELFVPMSAGTHQINVRVDGGAWEAPPNMPTMRDSYGGEVGLLVVAPDRTTH